MLSSRLSRPAQLCRSLHFRVEWGVYISDIITDSPAAEAGLRTGDTITQIGGISIDGDHPRPNSLYGFSPAQELEIQFFAITARKPSHWC
ncbi:MAG: PDZ domain-containing protein [Chloroflexi bacterium]|nr:MAG: PDZ domain-containing protein [Chloroflexota bacterium]